MEIGHKSVLPVCVAVSVYYRYNSFTSAFHIKKTNSINGREYVAVFANNYKYNAYIHPPTLLSVTLLYDCLIFVQIQLKTAIATVVIQFHKHSIYMQLWWTYGPDLQEFYRETEIAGTGSVNRNSRRANAMRINIGNTTRKLNGSTNFKSFLLCVYKSLDSSFFDVGSLNLPSQLNTVAIEKTL